ncbi:MAG: hypothetical protein E6Q75_13405 [Rheinheimera sp.]|nr:MAG: hypothetical protein E6Q75_13405 [Rheinheimera sp.]
MHSFKCLIFLITLCFTAYIPLSAAAPVKLIFSYTNHPAITYTLLPLIQQAYQRLGIEVAFVEANGGRFLKLAETGQIDGDVGRADVLLPLLRDMLPAAFLDDAVVSYHCRPTIKCALTDLNDPQQQLHTPVVSQILPLMQIKIAARLYPVNDWIQLQHMYLQGRVDRFLWIETLTFASEPHTNTQKFVLSHPPVKLYHLLHRRHQALAVKAGAEIARLRDIASKNRRLPAAEKQPESL